MNGAQHWAESIRCWDNADYLVRPYLTPVRSLRESPASEDPHQLALPEPADVRGAASKRLVRLGVTNLDAFRARRGLSSPKMEAQRGAIFEARAAAAAKRAAGMPIEDYLDWRLGLLDWMARRDALPLDLFEFVPDVAPSVVGELVSRINVHSLTRSQR